MPFLAQVVRTISFSEKVHSVQIASDLRLAIRITNRNRGQIARFGALSCLECHRWVLKRWGFKQLETNLASRWEGVRLPRASWKSSDFPGSAPNFLKVFGDFPGSSLTVELYSNPGVPRKVSQTFPEVPRTSPAVSRTSPEVSPFSGKPDTLS